MSILPFPNQSNPSTSTSPKNPSINIRLFSFLLCIFGIAIPFIFFTLHIEPTDTSSYHAKLLEKMEHAKSFEDFTNAMFCYKITSDSVTTAYTVKNPDNWNLPTLEPRLTSFSYQEYLTQSKKDTPDETSRLLKKCLTSFSRDNLSESEQLTYTLLEDSIDSSIALSQYPFYEELLGNSSGVQANLPVTLGEYPLRNKTDIETYLQLLTQIPSYFENIISYEKKRSELGYQTPAFLTATALQSSQTLISGLKNNDNSFLDTFHERLAHIDSLSEKQKAIYQKQNQSYVQKYVIPAYEKIESYLSDTLSQTENHTEVKTKNNTSDTSSSDPINLLSYIEENTSYGICTLPKGKEYYTLLAKQTTGSNRSMEELISMIETALSNALGTVLNVALTNQKAYYYYYENPLETYYQSPETILEALSLMIREDYPSLTNTPSYEVKTVSDSLANSLSPAFYMIPAIDDYKNNTIYINPLFTNDENGNLFPTLAHEGFPGHLYQTVYFNESNPADIRQILDYLGYVEGWATYVEMDSLTFLDYPLEYDSLCELYQADTIINLALCSRIDLGVNYEGWTLNNTRTFFENHGFNSYYAQDIYSYVVEAPANYLSYFIGYLEILDIKDAYQRQEMENYSEKEFHKKFLDIGPADFETIRKYILQY